MQEAPANLSMLPADFDQLPVEDAVRILLQSVIQHHDTYFDLRSRHKALVEWIEDE